MREPPPWVHRWLPETAARLPRLALGRFPTPTHSLRHLGTLAKTALWAKRDDLSAERYGGNKVRKLELMLAEAQQLGRKSIVTVGGYGSNHVVATSLYAAELGLRVHALVLPQPPTDHAVSNARLSAALGAQLVPLAPEVGLAHGLSRLLADIPDAYWIPPGGSAPLGTLGYVFAALELADQIERGELPAPDDIYLALGTGGSAVGLTIGCALAGLRCRVIGVRVVDRKICNAPLLVLLQQRTLRLIEGLGDAVPRPRPVTIDPHQLGPGYGSPTAAAREAQNAAEADQLSLETTYTAKALAAVLGLSGKADPSRRVLFWNTFNSRKVTPSLGADAADLPPTIARWAASDGPGREPAETARDA